MNKTVKKLLSGIVMLVMSMSMLTGCTPASAFEVKAPSASTTDVVETVPTETEEVGLTSGFELPHADGKVNNIYVYEDDLYFHNNEKYDGCDPGILFTGEEDLRDSYEKLFNKEKQFLLDASDDEVWDVVATKYGSWDEWIEKYLNKFYTVHSSHTATLSPETKQKYPDAAYGGYMLRTSYDLSDWVIEGEIEGHAVEGYANGWYQPNIRNWAPEIAREPMSGLYVVVGSSNTKSGDKTTDYHPFTNLGYDSYHEQYDNMIPYLAIATNPIGPYHYVTSEEYYSYIAKFNFDGTPYTIEIDGEKWAVYREDLKFDEGNEYGGYVPLTKVADDGITVLNQNGLNVTRDKCLLNAGYYHPEIWEAYQHWNDDYRGLFPGIDTNFLCDSKGDVYLYFSAHVGSVLSGNHVWVIPMKDLCTPDWENMTHVTSPSYSTIYYGEGKASSFEMRESDGQYFYQPHYIEFKGGKQNLQFAINGVPGYYMGRQSESGINEGTYVVEKDGYYYMTYSPFGYGSRQYSLYFAIADNPFGPFIKLPQYFPVFGLDQSETQDYMAGTGHHSFVTVGDEMWVVYHYFYNPVNNNNEDGGFLGRCIGVDRIGWYDYDGLKFETIMEEQIAKDIEFAKENANEETKSELYTVFNGDYEAMEEWLRECYETGNHRYYRQERGIERDWDKVIPVLYGSGPTYSLQPKPEVFTGYDNVAKYADVTILEGDQNTAKYANDAMFTYQKWSEDFEVVGSKDTRQLKVKLSWDTPQTIRNIMVYNSRDYVYAFNNVESIVFKLAGKPAWYPENKEFNGYAYIKDLKPDSQGWDDGNFVMRKGGSAMATFNEITVSEIIITIDAKDKVGELILTSANRYVVKLSEIYIMGNPATADQE